jgi:antitoxin CcdA
MMKLRAFLKLHGLTLEAFGERVGVSHVTVLRWCTGQTVPRGRDVLRRIAEATGGAVTVSDFFEELPAALAPKGQASEFADAQSPYIAEAAALNLDPAAIAQAALRKAIGDEKARRWLDDNRAAIEAWNRYFEENDTPLAKYRMF